MSFIKPRRIDSIASAIDVVVTGNQFYKTSAVGTNDDNCIVAFESGVGYTGAATDSVIIANNNFNGAALEYLGAAQMGVNSYDGVTILASHPAQKSITADSGSIQGGSPLVKEINEISVCASSGDSVTLPGARLGRRITIINNGANACDVFPQLGDNLGAGTNIASSLAAGSNITYAAYNNVSWEVI